MTNKETGRHPWTLGTYGYHWRSAGAINLKVGKGLVQVDTFEMPSRKSHYNVAEPIYGQWTTYGGQVPSLIRHNSGPTIDINLKFGTEKLPSILHIVFQAQCYSVNRCPYMPMENHWYTSHWYTNICEHSEMAK